MADEYREPSMPSWEDSWAIVLRRRWWLLAPFFCGWAAIWTASWLLPASYRSETLILIEQQKVPEHYVVSNVAVDLQERLQSMTQQILSRTRLLKIIDDLGLYPGERKHLSPDELVEQMRRDIEIELVRAPARREELTAFRIYYTAPEPRLAQQVTGQLTSLFIEENLRARQEQSESTTAFLEAQLEEARKDLASQEQRLREFKTRYLGELPEQLQSNVQILTGLQGRLQGMLAALNQAEQQRLYLDSLLAQYRSLQASLRAGTKADPNLPPALDQELERLKTQFADLSARYTERHPDVLHLKEQIAKTEKLKEQIQKELAAVALEAPVEAPPAPTSLAQLQAMSPMMQIESQRKANELEIQNRKREIQEAEAQMRELQARLNLTPLREQQLADITRDYTQSRANYESLLAKKMQSELATNLEKRQQGEQFRILDPPSLPQKPYRPDRRRLNIIGLVGGVLLGLACTAGFEMIDDRIYRERDLTELVGAPVLADIPPLPTVWEQRKQTWRRRLEWLAGSVLLLTMAAGSFVAMYWG